MPIHAVLEHYGPPSLSVCLSCLLELLLWPHVCTSVTVCHYGQIDHVCVHVSASDYVHVYVCIIMHPIISEPQSH